MPTAQNPLLVLRSTLARRVRSVHGRCAALALALMSASCQDPHYGGGTENISGPSSGARSPDSSTASSSSGNAAGVPKTDAAVDGRALDGGGASSSAKPDGDHRGTSGPGETPFPEGSDAAVSGATPPVSAVPGWAMPLLGRYATRWFAFKQDDFGTVVRAEQLAILEFTLDDQGMSLHSKLCLATGDTTLAELRLVDPSGLPERTEKLVFSDLERSWASEGPTYTAGFTREPPASCSGKLGQSVPKTPAQTWITGNTCRCASAGEEPLVDDCRILDPDHDQKPGVTYTLKGFTSSLADATLYAVTETDSHYVNGKVGADGAPPAADIVYVDHNYQLACEPAGCANIAVLGRACPISFNHALFVPLAAGKPTTCADLASNVNALFPDPPPSFPQRCFQ